MDKMVALTYEGIKDLEQELKNLKVERRKDIAQKIKDARAQGDLSENAEYDAAKDEQARIEARIVSIEKMLRNAVLIDQEDADKDTVGLGSKVTLFDEEFKEEITYHIVGSAEANPEKNRISNESPLGMGLLGRKGGEAVEIDAPMGIIKYKILAIS
ncbi:MAG: transcription elongation factor GreA [Clostridiales bacterium]|jgi:transcription elongation factor GreA|nr:transcription elongation factor GreA [Clostridiales bacterium]